MYLLVIAFITYWETNPPKYAPIIGSSDSLTREKARPYAKKLVLYSYDKVLSFMSSSRILLKSSESLVVQLDGVFLF